MLTLLLAVAVGLIVHRYAKRPRSMPLAKWTDGPAPSGAAGVLFFFHGRGGGIGEAGSRPTELLWPGVVGDVR